MMKRVFVLLLLLSLSALAVDKSYVKGTLVAVNVGKRTVGIPSNGGTLIAQKNLFQVAVRVDDLLYTGETRSGDVRQLVIGDPVEVRLEDKNFFVKRPAGKEVKVKLLTKARASAH
jgi:hypothetical protein